MTGLEEKQNIFVLTVYRVLTVYIKCTFVDKIWVVQLQETVVIKAVSAIYWWNTKLHEPGALLDMYIYGVPLTVFVFDHYSHTENTKNVEKTREIRIERNNSVLPKQSFPSSTVSLTLRATFATASAIFQYIPEGKNAFLYCL